MPLLISRCLTQNIDIKRHSPGPPSPWPGRRPETVFPVCLSSLSVDLPVCLILSDSFSFVFFCSSYRRLFFSPPCFRSFLSHLSAACFHLFPPFLSLRTTYLTLVQFPLSTSPASLHRPSTAESTSTHCLLSTLLPTSDTSPPHQSPSSVLRLPFFGGSHKHFHFHFSRQHSFCSFVFSQRFLLMRHRARLLLRWNWNAWPSTRSVPS